MTSFACDYYKLHNPFSIFWLNINWFAYEIAVPVVVSLANAIIVLHTTNYIYQKTKEMCNGQMDSKQLCKVAVVSYN